MSSFGRKDRSAIPEVAVQPKRPVMKEPLHRYAKGKAVSGVSLSGSHRFEMVVDGVKRPQNLARRSIIIDPKRKDETFASPAQRRKSMLPRKDRSLRRKDALDTGIHRTASQQSGGDSFYNSGIPSPNKSFNKVTSQQPFIDLNTSGGYGSGGDRSRSSSPAGRISRTRSTGSLQNFSVSGSVIRSIVGGGADNRPVSPTLILRSAIAGGTGAGGAFGSPGSRSVMDASAVNHGGNVGATSVASVISVGSPSKRSLLMSGSLARGKALPQHGIHNIQLSQEAFRNARKLQVRDSIEGFLIENDIDYLGLDEEDAEELAIAEASRVVNETTEPEGDLQSQRTPKQQKKHNSKIILQQRQLSHSAPGSPVFRGSNGGKMRLSDSGGAGSPNGGDVEAQSQQRRHRRLTKMLKFLQQTITSEQEPLKQGLENAAVNLFFPSDHLYSNQIISARCFVVDAVADFTQRCDDVLGKLDAAQLFMSHNRSKQRALRQEITISEQMLENATQEKLQVQDELRDLVETAEDNMGLNIRSVLSKYPSYWYNQPSISTFGPSQGGGASILAGGTYQSDAPNGAASFRGHSSKWYQQQHMKLVKEQQELRQQQKEQLLAADSPVGKREDLRSDAVTGGANPAEAHDHQQTDEIADASRNNLGAGSGNDADPRGGLNAEHFGINFDVVNKLSDKINAALALPVVPPPPPPPSYNRHVIADDMNPVLEQQNPPSARSANEQSDNNHTDGENSTNYHSNEVALNTPSLPTPHDLINSDMPLSSTSQLPHDQEDSLPKVTHSPAVRISIEDLVKSPEGPKTNSSSLSMLFPQDTVSSNDFVVSDVRMEKAESLESDGGSPGSRSRPRRAPSAPVPLSNSPRDVHTQAKALRLVQQHVELASNYEPEAVNDNEIENIAARELTTDTAVDVNEITSDTPADHEGVTPVSPTASTIEHEPAEIRSNTELTPTEEENHEENSGAQDDMKTARNDWRSKYQSYRKAKKKAKK